MRNVWWNSAGRGIHPCLPVLQAYKNRRVVPSGCVLPLMYALADLSEGRRSFGLLTQGIFIDVMGRIHFAQPWIRDFVIKTVAVFACLFGLILGIICAVQSNIIR